MLLIELSLKVYTTLFVHNFIIVHSNNKLALGYSSSVPCTISCLKGIIDLHYSTACVVVM